jgi:alkylation response protein AidB-like acyl-CoA dehydrogenase
MMRPRGRLAATPRPSGFPARKVLAVDHPAVAAARDIADSLLRPKAEQVDVQGVPRTHLDALAAAGLMNVPALPAPVGRQVAETLAGADASTWFVWTQHVTPVRTVERGSNTALRERWLPRLTAGESLAGVAFTHLRRPGPPPLSARADGDGWVVDGEIAWLTGWGIADVFLVGAPCVGATSAESGRGEDVVWLLLPLRDRPEAVAEALPLAAMGGTSTVRLTLRGLRCGADDVVLVEPLAAWRATDAARTADVSAAVFGVTAEVVRRLRERDESVALEVAADLEQQLLALREVAYHLIDDVPAGEQVQQRLVVRARAHALACRATAALVTAGAGRSMLLDAAAQRLARVAMFLLVQGQTAPVREATLRELAGG